jgi:hypothetical protein
LDFACTSGLRLDRLRNATENPEIVLTDYEQFKVDFIAAGDTESTAVLCRRQGITFIPMVIESHGGGWSKKARLIFDVIAKHVDAAWNTNAEAASLSIAQRLSTTLHRENARAVVMRLQDLPSDDEVADNWTPGDHSPGWTAGGEQHLAGSGRLPACYGL